MIAEAKKEFGNGWIYLCYAFIKELKRPIYDLSLFNIGDVLFQLLQPYGLTLTAGLTSSS